MELTQQILAVDDLPANLLALEKTLEGTGAALVTATGGNEALTATLERDFALAIVDVQMPVMDGYELAELLRGDPKTRNLPIIFLTATSPDEDQIFKGYQSGAVDYLIKPYNPQILLSKVKIFLELHAQKVKLRRQREQIEERAAQLVVAMERAESADRLKSAFLATMSHELRTPLNSIIGFTGIMLQRLPGPLNDEQEKQLGMVQGSARHLLDLINDVLDISKIEAGQLEIVARPFDIREVIRKTVGTMTPLAEDKGLALAAELAPEVGWITSDRRRVEQILLNLLGNAVKFTDKGEVHIVCEINNDQLVTRVVDTGIGIRPADMGALFDPFQQVDNGLARPREGTGLGLSICRRLVEMLGGEISVSSEQGAGSAFTFALPIRQLKGEKQ